MKTLLSCLVFAIISDNICHGCQNFSVYNVTFAATNFVYILQWDHLDKEANVMFSVQYKRYGNKVWSIKEECQNITRLYCNLTDEFTVDENAFMEQYFGRVRAFSTNCSSDWVMSKRLNPNDDTYIDQIELNIIEDVHSITIKVQHPPMAAKSKNQQQNTTEYLYKDGLFKYYMSFDSTEDREIWQKTQTDNTFEVHGLNPDTKYNGSVYILINNKKKSDIKTFVVKTLPDPLFVRLVVCMLAISLALLAGVLLYKICQYVKQQGHIPQSLDFGKSSPFVVLHPSTDMVNTLYTAYSSQQSVQIFSDLQKLPHNAGNCVYRTRLPNITYTEQTNLLPPMDQDINNSKMDSLNDYGLFGDLTSYKKNNTPNPTCGTECNQFSYHCQMETGDTIWGNDEEECKNVKSTLTLSCQEANNTLDVNRTLLSTVILYGHLEFKEDIKQYEQQKTVLFSNPSNGHACSDNQTDRKALEDSKGEDQYTFQHPHRYIKADGLDNTEMCQNPYRLQN